MGSIASQNTLQQQNISTLYFQSQQQLKILEWRSNPCNNEFIPKVIFQYQQNKNKRTFLNQCQFNENLPVGIKYQKFIGNLSLLQGKLSFQESLYVLKCLLSGYQAILTYFGKAIVQAGFCFLSKQGEVKAWINQDYKKNSFQTEKLNSTRSILDDKKLFLKPQNWVDVYKPSSSSANIIRGILILVSDLTYLQNQFNIFLQKIDTFITSNILKNYSFERIARFVNRYIYQNKLFVKSNLIEVIQRLYYQNCNQKETSLKSIVSKEGHLQRNPSRVSTVTENKSLQALQTSSLRLRKCVSAGRKDSNVQLQFTKNSQFFNSTAHTNTNTITKFNSIGQSQNFNNLKQCPVYGSHCSSHLSGYQFIQKKQTKPFFIDKNHISHQFSMNYTTITNKVPVSENKISSFNPSPKSSFISSKSSIKNKMVDFKIQDDNLKIITQRKQTQPEQKFQPTVFRKNEECGKSISIKQQNKSQFIAEQLPYKNENSKYSKGMNNFIQPVKKSNVSIGFAVPQNVPSCSSKSNLKMFKSNCDNAEKQNRRFNFYYTGFKSHNEQDSMDGESEATHNIFTMKTITKLINSNQNLSGQQESEGDFPSNQNVSSYSGILASMGRSAQIIQIPQVQKLDFRSNKKQKTMFVVNRNPVDKTTFMSYDKFQVQ